MAAWQGRLYVQDEHSCAGQEKHHIERAAPGTHLTSGADIPENTQHFGHYFISPVSYYLLVLFIIFLIADEIIISEMIEYAAHSQTGCETT